MSPASSALGRALVASLALLGSAQAVDLSAADVTLGVRAMPEAHVARTDSPFAPASTLDGIGQDRGRGEVDLSIRYRGLTADVAGRLTSRRGQPPLSEGVLNQLHYDVEALGAHLTVGKKVLSWDVGFGYRPLDVIQQEERRALVPFTLEGVPLVALERFGADDAWTLVYANPLRGRAAAARDDESGALRYYRRLGPLDAHALVRWSLRTRLESGAAFTAVLGDALELHGSYLYQQRTERRVDALVGQPDGALAAGDPSVVRVCRDGMAGLVGATLTPGWNLSILAEAWLDPRASTRSEWRDMSRLAVAQRALLNDPSTPREAVLGNLAFGARFFDRPNLLRQNVLLRVSGKWDRFEPAVDVLLTPEDRGWVATGAVAWEGEESRLEVGARMFGGPVDAAYRLYPERAILYASWALHY
jgi:hypothetical protein